jgi:spore coat protein A
MITRRTFFTMTGAGALALVAVDAAGQRRVLAEALPGGTLAAGDIPRFATALVIPGVMPRTSRLTRRGGKNLDTYEVAVRQFTQQVLPAGLPATTVWGFGPAADRDTARFHAPSLTIEVDHTRPVRIRWSNELVDDTGAALAHLLRGRPHPALGQPGATSG